jgi:hypothetical protein
MVVPSSGGSEPSITRAFGSIEFNWCVLTFRSPFYFLILLKTLKGFWSVYGAKLESSLKSPIVKKSMIHCAGAQ